MARRWILALALLGAAHAASAEVLCKIATTGTDTETCTGMQTYASPTTCEAAIPNSPTDVYNCEIQDSGTYGAVTINVTGTSETAYVKLSVLKSQRHAGVKGTGPKIDAGGSGNGILNISDYTSIEWIEVTNTGAAAAGIYTSGAENVSISNVIVHDVTSQGIRGDGTTASATIANSVVHDAADCLFLSGGGSNADWTVKSSIFDDCSSDVLDSSLAASSDLNLYSNTFSGNWNAGSETLTEDYNFFTDDVAFSIGSNSKENVTLVDSAGSCGTDCHLVTSLTEGSEDYTIVDDAANDAVDAGDPINSTIVAIDETFRITPDIGPFEIAGAVAGKALLATGDSITLGVQSSPTDDAWVDALKILLPDFAIVRGACGGTTTNGWVPDHPGGICNGSAVPNNFYIDIIQANLPIGHVSIAFGTNEVAFNVSTAKFRSNLEAIVDEINTDSPTTKVLLIGAPRRCTSGVPQHPQGTIGNPIVAAQYVVAKEVARVRDWVSVAYNSYTDLDVSTDFGSCNVHPNGDGHQKIADAIAGYLDSPPTHRGNPRLP